MGKGHGISKLFHREKADDNENGHHGLSRILHHHSNGSSGDVAEEKQHQSDALSVLLHRLSRALSVSSVQASSRSNANDQRNPRKNLRKADTFSLNTSRPPPSSSLHKNNSFVHEKIKYNPYGINKEMGDTKQHLAAFYLSGGPDTGGRVLQNPVADPNDYLPGELHEDHINLLDHFEVDLLEAKLGDGGSGDVRTVQLSCDKKKIYALKKFLLFPKETDEEFYQRVSKEYIISKHITGLRHVVNTIALLRLQSQGSMTRGWGFVMEFCPGGDLFNMIVKPGWRKSLLNERYCLFKQVAHGLKFLHEKDIVHRDMKPENVIFDKHGIAKLCDFGVSDYGHEEPFNMNSPIKHFTSYVGSPPYSPPEVMKLRDMPNSERSSNAYDGFKMDTWGLGMLMFCLIYCGVPFQISLVSDHQYRDYKFNRDRFVSNHPLFKNNTEFARGPGSEFKWAAKFENNGAARVAWKLCDPSPESRYDINNLFEDPWFTSIEMCIYEHPDQTVNPLVQGVTSNSSSASSIYNSSNLPSRRNTASSVHHDEEASNLHTPFRSMLDLAGVPGAQGDDSHSVKSNSLLSHSKQSHEDRGLRHRASSDLSVHSQNSSTGNGLKVRSMLDNPSEEKSTLPSLAEAENEDVKEAPAEEHNGDDQDNNLSPSNPSSDSEFCDCKETAADGQLAEANDKNNAVAAVRKKAESDSKNELRDSFELVSETPLHDSEDFKMDSNGCCDLGYKIKKHHHLEISSVKLKR